MTASRHVSTGAEAGPVDIAAAAPPQFVVLVSHDFTPARSESRAPTYQEL